MITTAVSGSATVDEVDLGIIHCLQVDGRAAFVAIADVLAVSEQTVARRYRRLRSEGLVRVVVVQDPAGWGQLGWGVRIQSRPESTALLAAALAERDDVSWVTIGAGGANVSASLKLRSLADRDDLLLSRLPRNTHVLGLAVHSVLRRFLPTGGTDWTVGSPLVSAEDEAVLRVERLPSDARPTPEDRALIAALADDGRTSVADLAKVTGWSVSRVGRRLEALLGSGALCVDCDVATELLGWTTSAELWLTVEPGHLPAVGQAVADLDAIAFTAAITGPTNLLAVGLFRSSDEMYACLTDGIGALPGVRQAELSPILRVVKKAGAKVDGERLRL